MKLMNTRTLIAPVLALGVAVLFVGCEQKGPAQKAGENLDKAGQNVKDAVDPPSTGEKVGREIDKRTPNK